MVIGLRRGLALLIGLALIISFGIGVKAQDSVESALKQATQFLSKQLGKPIAAVDTYTYELVTFPDAGLGCPEPGKTYPANPTQGYKFVITVEGISYEVHTTLDGLHAALCSNTQIKQDVSLSIYRSPLFSIAYPNRWNFIERQTDIFFGLSATPVCSQPGMTVTVLGTVTTDKTPDKLLNDYAQTTPGVKLGAERISIGSTGRSAVFVAPCADGSPRATRISAFLAYGRGYRILQFAPQNAFDQWADTFLKILQQFSPGRAGGSASSGQAVKLPDQSPLAMVVHIFGGNVYVGSLTDLPGTPVTTDGGGDHVYRDVAVAPGGDKVAFVDPVGAALYVAAASGGQTPRKLVGKVVVGYPPAWSPDGGEIAYLVDEGTKDGERAVYALMAARSDGTGTRKIGDTLSIRIGCGGALTTTDPAEQLYWSEVGFGGNGLLLVWSHAGAIYYSLGCDGVGVGQLTDGSQSSSIVHPELRRAHLSPNGKELLGLIGAVGQPPKLARINPQERSATTISTDIVPDQAVWSPDGKAVYYSTAVARETIRLDGEAQRDAGLRVFGTWPFETTIYDVSLHRIDLATSTDSELYKGTGRAVGHIAPSPDGAGILFTFVQGDSNLVEAFKNNVPAADLKEQAPSTLLYWLPLPDGQPLLLAVTADPIWGPLGSAAAPTPTSSARQPVPTQGTKPGQTPSAVPAPTYTREPGTPDTGH